jgi:phosphotransferase system  glucose/maltose/N-acetylglucosamine-specific IIC component
MSEPSDREEPSTLGLLMKSAVLVFAAAAGGAAQRAITLVAGWLVVAVLGTVSLGFLTLAGYVALAQALDRTLAALIVGLAYLFVALVLVVVLQSRRR